MVNMTSRLESRIFDEAAQSVSSDGTYIIDRLNNNPQVTNVSLDKSEHRNVLFIMAGGPFKLQTSRPRMLRNYSPIILVFSGTNPRGNLRLRINLQEVWLIRVLIEHDIDAG